MHSTVCPNNTSNMNAMWIRRCHGFQGHIPSSQAQSPSLEQCLGKGIQELLLWKSWTYPASQVWAGEFSMYSFLLVLTYSDSKLLLGKGRRETLLTAALVGVFGGFF